MKCFVCILPILEAGTTTLNTKEKEENVPLTEINFQLLNYDSS